MGRMSVSTQHTDWRIKLLNCSYWAAKPWKKKKNGPHWQWHLASPPKKCKVPNILPETTLKYCTFTHSMSPVIPGCSFELNQQGISFTVPRNTGSMSTLLATLWWAFFLLHLFSYIHFCCGHICKKSSQSFDSTALVSKPHNDVVRHRQRWVTRANVEMRKNGLLLSAMESKAS